MDFLTGGWGFFFSNLASYWVGWLMYRRIYTERLKRLVENQRAVMDTIIDQVDDPASLLPFCSDGLLRGTVMQVAEADSRAQRIAAQVLRSRGLEVPKPGMEV